MYAPTNLPSPCYLLILKTSNVLIRSLQCLKYLLEKNVFVRCQRHYINLESLVRRLYLRQKPKGEDILRDVFDKRQFPLLLNQISTLVGSYRGPIFIRSLLFGPFWLYLLLYVLPACPYTFLLQRFQLGFNSRVS